MRLQHTQVHPPCVAENRTTLHPACLAHPAGHRACDVSKWWGQRLDRHALSPTPTPFHNVKIHLFHATAMLMHTTSIHPIIEDHQGLLFPSQPSPSSGFLGQACASWCVRLPERAESPTSWNEGSPFKGLLYSKGRMGRGEAGEWEKNSTQ